MKKASSSYKEIREFIEANYIKDKEKIDKIGIEDYNDHVIDKVLGKELFENEVDEFLYMLAICVIMRKMKLNDEYFFNSIEELIKSYKEGLYDLFLFDKNDIELINKDIKLI